MDNYLLLRFYAGEELAYMMPVGTGDVKPVLEALIKDAEEMGAKLRTLDDLGRCETAFALVDPETLPDKPRGDISNVHPSGWKQARCV